MQFKIIFPTLYGWQMLLRNTATISTEIAFVFIISVILLVLAKKWLNVCESIPQVILIWCWPIYSSDIRKAKAYCIMAYLIAIPIK